MKKILLIAILVFATIEAKSQFFMGLAFDVKWANDGTVLSNGNITNHNNTYGGSVSPQFGYQFNPKLQAGGRVNFLFDKSYYITTDETTKVDTKYVNSSIGWDFAPFVRYKFMELGKDGWFSIWADLHAYFGLMYPRSVEEHGYIFTNFNQKYIYGVQAMPAVGIRINEKSTLFLNIALLSLAYSGTSTNYGDKTEYENRVVLFTGKITGLLTTLVAEGMYGFKIGMVRTF